jgi:hypothetical protein
VKSNDDSIKFSDDLSTNVVARESTRDFAREGRKSEIFNHKYSQMN